MFKILSSKINTYFDRKNTNLLIEILTHLLFWACIIYMFITSSFLRPISSITSELLSVTFIMIACYTNYFVIYPYVFKKNKWIYFIVSFLSVVLITVLEMLIVTPDIKNCFHSIKPEVQKIIIRDAYLLIFCRDLAFMSFFVLFRFYKAANHALHLEKEQRLLKEQIQQVEINNLRTTIAPHFVFNNLNRIRADIAKHPEKAEDKVIAVARLLRTFFDDSSQQFISVLDEVQFIKDLVNLENDYRYKNLDVQFTYDHLNGSEKIAPLLFQTFISNAFKFVQNKNGYIHIHLKKENNRLIFSCENSIASERLPSIVSTGSGIKNTRKRLDLLYPDQYKLSVSETETVFSVELKLYNLGN